MQPIGGGFHRNAAGLVGHKPVQLGQRQLVTERNIYNVGFLQQGAGLCQRCTAAQQPGDQLKLGDVVFTVCRRVVDGVAHKIQPGNAEALFIDGIVIQRVLPCHIGHADHGIPCAEIPHAAQGKRIAARRDRDFIPIGEFIVKIASEIEICCLIGCCGTHGKCPFPIS